MHLKRILPIALAFCLSLLLTDRTHAQHITVKNGQFMLGNKPYYFVGANYWYGGLLAIAKDPEVGKARLRKELDMMKANGITNLRVLAGGEGEGLMNGVNRVKPALQPKHNIFDPEVMKGLDYLLYEMGKRKMYAVLYLSNEWDWSGGFLQYLIWNGKLSKDSIENKVDWPTLQRYSSRFYSCEPCVQDYKKQLEYVVKHVNTYTKKPYTQDPAIMAWELANEPRPMRPEAVEAYKQFTSSMAAHIKQLDKNHLVTLGTEGSIGTQESTELLKEVHAPAQVDYLTIHIWPKNWLWFSDTSIVKGMPTVIKNTKDYLYKNVEVAKALNKPIVIEEFGLPRDRHSFEISSTTSSRDKYYASIFEELLKSKQSNGIIAGANFWAMGGTSRPIPGQLFHKDGDDMMGDPPQEEQGLNAVFDSDRTTWEVIKKYALMIK
ncbi:cellulase family glycosylhydrolase [Mucilaginibacter daejeonensis]|uniref:glycoside hydrolase 5 family protein n=1 Tax=Mucilaginibacter daejeonensis TaxID=398049 RepID=UPI001D1790DC|nr:cellulase family glycosylhydrolase [Mucilaginibacter daejeonensis]UEG54961.1 cellulase family glycosylhydrolase [Mucilaginibacter daejeonensis]